MRFLAISLVVAGSIWAFSPAVAASSSQNVDESCPPGQVQGDDGLCVQTKGARMGYDFVPDTDAAPGAAATAQPVKAKVKNVHHKTAKVAASENASK